MTRAMLITHMHPETSSDAVVEVRRARSRGGRGADLHSR